MNTRGLSIAPLGAIFAGATTSVTAFTSALLASARGVTRERFFRQLPGYGAAATLIAPIAVWLHLFVVL